MGYSISVKFKNANQRDMMYDFLIKNNYILNHTFSTEDNTPHLGEELSYAPNFKNVLGFHGRLIGDHLWAVCAWMAFKNNIQSSDGRYKFYYDDEKMYAVVGESDLNTQDFIIDSNGIIVIRGTKPSDPPEYIQYLNAFKEVKEHTRFMILTLNDEFDKYKLNLDLKKSQIQSKTLSVKKIK